MEIVDVWGFLHAYVFPNRYYSTVLRIEVLRALSAERGIGCLSCSGQPEKRE